MHELIKMYHPANNNRTHANDDFQEMYLHQWLTVMLFLPMCLGSKVGAINDDPLPVQGSTGKDASITELPISECMAS